MWYEPCIFSHFIIYILAYSPHPVFVAFAHLTVHKRTVAFIDHRLCAVRYSLRQLTLPNKSLCIARVPEF